MNESILDSLVGVLRLYWVASSLEKGHFAWSFPQGSESKIL